MNVVFSKEAWDDYVKWQSDKRVLKKINTLIKTIQRTPTEGAGNPEALKHALSGYWSRRIDGEHRLVYSFSDTEVVIVSCRYHYR
ncbi:toxin YoeB (plasmid) [Fulvitalea axinellae]|uniref:Putative mRNA interferase YoeB n=1 Tax=Fulvitalea axinellae TaxID=1182444 RepID=A0AAU9DIH0_9BACT|nr:toxin YoeB [Fulvitalea axinellae]